MKVLLGISGASGAVYGVRTLSLLLGCGADVHVVVTKTAWGILAEESGEAGLPGDPEERREWLARAASAGLPFLLHDEEDFGIPFSSGSNPPDAMIVAPCSMGTLARIAHGISTSVLTRCADVALKERRPLVLVTRETPLSVIHIENMLAAARAGARILPACPGFYHRPATVSSLVDFVAARALACAGLDAGILHRWGEGKEE